jgi:hypothetical protein
MLAAIGAVVLLAASAGGGSAQQAALDQQLAGAWRLTQDGAKDDVLGPKAEGTIIFVGGHFALQMVDPGMARFSSDDRRAATSAERKASAKGSLAYFGTYDANDSDHTLTLHITRSSFPNWNGTDQKWIVSIASDKLTLTDAREGGVALVWAHAAPAGEPAFETRGGRRIVHF